MKVLVSALFTLLLSVSVFGQLQSPDEFLPHKLGEHFTPHHMLVDYFEHVADNSPLVKLIEYGRTNQDRPMIVAIITSEANHAILEDIRLNNMRMTGLIEGTVDPSLSRALVWLSFSVHGNEAAGSESSHQVIYDLVDPNNTKTKQWLDNTVVIMDPSINPDGYSRYTHWVRNVSSAKNNTDINDIEHNEPWPGGRVSHYLFDLNRDWAWQTQIESQQRMALYNQWLPHVHADLHEMGHESPYYFAPASKPYHKFITQWQRDFQTTIGKNHAKYFDQEGWLYFTKEVFDLFYPSYGDTYPTFSGAIGMTYEQGGSRVGGRGVDLRNGETLTLMDRIEHHKTTALSTIEISSINSDALITQFSDFYQKTSADPVGKYSTYILKKDKSGQRLKALAELLDKQDISYRTVTSTKTGRGFNYETQTETSFSIEEGDLVVSAHQPKSILAQVLLDPESELEDSVTYDITAWSLPYAYGLEAYATTSKISADKEWFLGDGTMSQLENAYAIVIPWTDLESAKAAAWLAKNNISTRVITEQVNYNGQVFEPGAIVVTRADNRSIGVNLAAVTAGIEETSAAQLIPIQSGFAVSGPDLGSGKVDLKTKPKVLTIMGDGISNLAFGQVKWYFDQVIDYPITVVDIDRMNRINLADYTTLILPDGWYSLSNKDEISSWVNKGGKLIAMGNSTRLFVDDENFSLKSYATDEEKNTAEKENEKADLAARYNHYSSAERNSISSYVPGALFKLNVDQTHPLGYGLNSSYFSLRTSTNRYPLIVNQSNVLTHPKDNAMVIGFAGQKAQNKLLDSVAFAVENKGRGTVIYMVDNPLFRGFWYNGLFLFSNGLFLVD